MNSIRNKYIQKPHILQQIIYNHRIQINDSQSQPSFLKLSSRGSVDLSQHECHQLFKDMNKRLENIRISSIQKVKQVKSRLQMYQQTTLQNRLIDKHLMEQKKQRISLTYRKLQNYNNYFQNFQECNFQMDQNRNYVLSQQLQPSNSCKLSQKKSSNYQLQNKPVCLNYSKVQKPIISSKIPYSSSCPKNNNKPNNNNKPKNSNKSTPKIVNRKSLQRLSTKNNHIKTRKTLQTGSHEQTKRSTSRIYEEILSLYSTAKLLAMQKQAF